ncbi:MAG: P-loop NTPase [Halobacteriota archaeon]
MILAVVGGKGGVGKSTLAYNLGASLDAVVVDADLAMADLPGGTGPDLHDVLAGRADPVEAIRGGSVAMLPCGRTLAGARAADLSALASALRCVEPEFDTVVVDCPAGMRADVGVPLAVADACLLVTTPSAAALADAVRTRALARELDAGLVAVALNRVSEDPETTRYERALGAPVTPVPSDARLARSTVHAVPVVDSAPDSAAAKSVRQLARAVEMCRR